MEFKPHRRVLGIVGSPRKNGNTDKLVDTVLASAEENGAYINKIFLNDLDISPCQACDACRNEGICKQNDDMKELIDYMSDSDIWVIGTPIYWWGPSAILKAFIDRWYGVNQSIFQGKRLALVIAMGGGDDFYSRHVTGMFEDISNYLEMEFYDALIAPCMRNKTSASEDSNLMERAKDFGLVLLDSDCTTLSKAKSSTT